MSVCPSCRQANPDTATFCSACGARMPPAPSPASPVFAAAPKGEERRNGQATAGLVLGIISLFGWLLPFIGFPVTVVGIVMSAIGLKSQKQGQAVAGLVMSILGLIGTIANAALGAIFGLLSL